MRSKTVLISVFSALVLLSVAAFYSYYSLGVRPSIRDGSAPDYITLPEGFGIEVFADTLGESSLSTPGPNTGPRLMEIKDDIIFVSLTSMGKVVALPDMDDDKKADEIVTVIDGLDRPHGMAFHKDWLYIAEEDKVIRVKYLGNLAVDRNSVEKLLDLPSGGHFTRTIRIFDDSLFISVGSSCDVCYEDNQMRAAITKCDLDGKNCAVFARGSRNAVGFVFHPETKEMWATENGRDNLGEDLPPDEINIIKEGKDYGWPICYGDRIHDTDFDKNVYVRDPCSETEPAEVELQAHSAPLGLGFYFGDKFPEEYKGNLFVGFHGSWNRKEPTGYKVVRIMFDGSGYSVEDFAVGWLRGQNVLGRPVDVVEKDGDLYVSADNAGKIYRIFYNR